MRITSMDMEDYIYRVIVPEEEHVEKTKSGKEKIVKIKNFPGYVLVEMIMSDEAWFVVRNTPGVTGFLGSHGQGSKPTPLLPDEVRNILSSLGEGGRNRDISFDIDEVVKVTDGGKLKLTVEMFGRETLAEVDYDQVDKF